MFGKMYAYKMVLNIVNNVCYTRASGYQPRKWMGYPVKIQFAILILDGFSEIARWNKFKYCSRLIENQMAPISLLSS